MGDMGEFTDMRIWGEMWEAIQRAWGNVGDMGDI